MLLLSANKMKAFSALLLLVRASANTPPATLGYCKSLCKEARQSVLIDLDNCKKAIKIDPKLFNTCIEGRKKAFDQACIPLCTNAEMSVSSFESCQVIAKKGQKSVDWCRKGYDSILQNLESLLVEHSEKLNKQQDIEEESEESGSAQDESVQESEPVKTDSLKIQSVNSEPVKSDPGESEPMKSEPVQSEHKVEHVENGTPHEAESNEDNADDGHVIALDDVYVKQQQHASEILEESQNEREDEKQDSYSKSLRHGGVSRQDGAIAEEDRNLEL